MKAMLIALATMILITIAAPHALDQAGFSAAERGSGDAVRLD
ncbi:hypothetical protein [Pukyongiella litopenaei]|nr:hypothetical protein [Pukyongiella litopenaei]